MSRKHLVVRTSRGPSTARASSSRRLLPTPDSPSTTRTSQPEPAVVRRVSSGPPPEERDRAPGPGSHADPLGRVSGQDLRVERQRLRRRVGAQLLPQDPAGVLVGPEGLGGPAEPCKARHLAAVAVLPERLDGQRGREALQCSGVVAAGRGRLARPHQHVDPPSGQLPTLALDPLRARVGAEQLPVPHRHGLVPPAGGHELLDVADVGRAPQAVTRPLGDQRVPPPSRGPGGPGSPQCRRPPPGAWAAGPTAAR